MTLLGYFTTMWPSSEINMPSLGREREFSSSTNAFCGILLSFRKA
jgi:hypothetical protein